MDCTIDSKNKFLIDNDSLTEDIEEILEEIKLLRLTKEFSQAVGTQQSEKIKTWENTIRKRLSAPFSIVTAGDFKRGKSTLINAILGKEVVTAAVTPETVTINKITYDQEPSVSAVLKNGKKTRLNSEDIKKENLEKIIPGLPAEINYLDIRDNSEILQNIAFVDTPGVGDVMKKFDTQVADFLVNADALLYVISARSPLSLSEQSFLAAAVLPQSFSRLFLIVNMADTLENKEDIEKITALTEERIKSIIPSASVFAVSALDELSKKLCVKRPLPELSEYLEHSFDMFENSLKNDIILQKDVIKALRAMSLIKQMLATIASGLNKTRNMLKLNTESLEKLEFEYKDENSKLAKEIEKKKTSLGIEIDSMKQEARKWMKEFMDRLLAELKSMKTSADGNKIIKHFQFFMMDKVKEAMQMCMFKHRKDIEEVIVNIAKELSLEITGKDLTNIDTTIAQNMAVLPWTGADTAVFALNIGADMLAQAQIPAGEIIMLGQVISGFIRQKTLENKQADLLTPILQNYDEVNDSVINKMDELYNVLKRNAQDRLEEINKEQIESTLNAVMHAQEIKKNENIKAEDIEEELKKAEEKLKELNEKIDKYQ